MDRREFLVASGGGIGILSVPSMAGCSSTGAGNAFDPGPYVVGDELLVFVLFRADLAGFVVVYAAGRDKPGAVHDVGTAAPAFVFVICVLVLAFFIVIEV